MSLCNIIFVFLLKKQTLDLIFLLIIVKVTFDCVSLSLTIIKMSIGIKY
jgi:hypothetical protein